MFAGLSDDEFERLRRFRKVVLFYYHCLMSSLPPFAWLALFFLHAKGGMYQNYRMVSSVWTAIIFVWVYFVCSGMMQ